MRNVATVTVVGRRREDGKRVVSALTHSGHVRRVLITVCDDDIPTPLRTRIDAEMDAGNEPKLYADCNIPLDYGDPRPVKLSNWRYTNV